VALGSSELFELFLALAPARLGAARSALELGDEKARALELGASLIPFAVDATLLGADGLSELARAVAESAASPRADLLTALHELELAAAALEHGDASGARTDESRLLELARGLRRAEEPLPSPDAARLALPGGGSAADPESVWAPDLPEDMLGAFLDECVERTEALSERLLALEQRGAERELVDEIFRDLHTLKGSSGFAGLAKMNRVAHRAEDLVGELRDGKRQLDRPLVSVLLETLDVLRAILARARERRPIDVDVSALLARLSEPVLAEKPQPERAFAEAAPRVATEPGKSSAGAQGTLRIEFEKVDRLLNLVGEIVLARGRLHSASELQEGVLHEVAQLRKRVLSEGERHEESIADELERTERVLRDNYRDLDAGLGGLGLAVGQLRDTVMKLRMVPIARLFGKYQRTVRELSHRLGKEVAVELKGAETELDKVLVERLEDPMLHLVRNAVDHGIELPEARRTAGKPLVGRLLLEAIQRGGQIFVRVSDDGRGLDAARLKAKAVERGLLSESAASSLGERDAFELIFHPGFSTADRLSDVSGRGVGMDVVRSAIAGLKGSIEIHSELGRGTTFELALPLTLAISQVLTVRVGGEVVAIPLDAVVNAQNLAPDELETVGAGTCLRQGDELVPALDLATALGVAGVSLGQPAQKSAVVVAIGASKVALLVQQVLGRHEIVIKSLGPMLTRAPCAAGAALIGDRMVLVLDLSDVLSRDRGGGSRRIPARPTFRARGRVLVAEDSDVLRESIRRELESAGFEVSAARDGQEALELSAGSRFDAVCTDVVMPRLDGYELTRRLRQKAGYADVPIVMVTSKDARLDALRGLDAGADAYLKKPVDADELIRTLLGLLSRRAPPARRAPETPPTAE
jgi:chemotaxis protein histidine kinase CheA/ActR/RegA family two-component response regulator